LPSGELLIATQGGVLFRWDGVGAAQPVLDLSAAVCAGGETGLLGLAVDPSFESSSPYIYLYYTHRIGGGGCDAASRANRVSRFTVDNSGNVGGETVLIDNIAAPGGNHNAGDLQFDSGGLLYISSGDGGSTPDTARRLDTLNGKILRITRAGGIPAGNPYQGAGTVQCSATGAVPGALSSPQNQEQDQQKKKKKSKKKSKRGGGKHKKGDKSKKKKRADRRDEKRKRRQAKRGAGETGPGPSGSSLICQEIFATGLRNPFRIAFDSNDTNGAQRFFINDVGGGAWEEIDEGLPGADYGWNVREGPCFLGSTTNCAQPSGFVEPIHAYEHQTGCRTITGGAFVPNGAGWPVVFAGDYLFADLACGRIFALDGAGSGITVTQFATGAGAVHLKFGDDGALYYTTYEGGGQVRRIVFTG
jgi:glucose/arabinose dehydrogenase